MHTQSIIIHRPRLVPATYAHTQLACMALYPDAHAGWLLMLHGDNSNICRWTEGVGLQQHPDLDKDSYQHLHPCAADVQALIHLPREQRSFFFLKCFVMVFCSSPVLL